MVELARLHRELEASIAAIEAETRKIRPDMPSLTLARVRITQASRKRAMHLDQLIGGLRARSVRPDPMLEGLAQDLQRARMRSAAHIGQWTPKAIESDWAGYCRASAHVRVAMREQIKREVAILRPLLEVRAA